MRKVLMYILLGVVWCVQQQSGGSHPIAHDSQDENRATVSGPSQADHSGDEYGVRRQDDIKHKNNIYSSTQQGTSLMSEFEVDERDIGSNYQVANLESTYLDAAYDGSLRNNMHSDVLYTYNKHRTNDSRENKSQGSEEIKPESSGFNNPNKTSVLSNSNVPDDTIHVQKRQNPFDEEDMTKDSEDVEEYDDDTYSFGVIVGGGDDHDEDYGDIEEDYAKKIQETLKNDTNYTGL